MKDSSLFLTEQLLEEPPYSSASRTNDLFMESLREELIFHYDHNEQYRKFCDRKGFDAHAPVLHIENIPPVSVSVFKELGNTLSSVPEEDIKLRLQSSATSGTPSTVVVDRITSRRQAKAMVKVVQEYLGKEKKPFLVMDIDPHSQFKSLLGARFAAIAGYLSFASKAGFFLKAKNGVSYFDIDEILEFVAKLPDNQPVVVFGFTYILYSNVLKAIRDKGITIPLPSGSKIIHIGGWKKLEAEKVDKDVFNAEIASCFNLVPTDVIDIYGFTEQMGLNYPDCQCGCKHTSSFVRVIARDVITGKILPPGKEGKLEFVTPLPHSYPGNAVLTDDMGIIYNEPCPYGRAGIRFCVTGRMKKAEIRGCGDVLSEKLTFRESVPNQHKDTNLSILMFKDKIPDCIDSSHTLSEIISSLRKKQNWLQSQPFDALIGLIGAASKRWLTDSKYEEFKDKGLFFLSNWCSEEHLREVAKIGLRGTPKYTDGFLRFPDSDKHLLAAYPRGLCCHWLAGNVQILGFFALVQSILTKNVNLLKVSGRDDGVFTSLLKAFEDLEFTTDAGHTISGNDLLSTIAVVYFSRHACELGELMSSSADVRIAWGGQEAVRSVSNYPSKIGSETIIFGPKLSFSVISHELLSDEQSAKKIARRVSVDVALFDQTGCASPHNLFIEKGGNISPRHFCDLLDEAMQKTERQIPKPTITPEQMSAIHSVREVYDFRGISIGSDSMSYSILFDETNELHKPVYSRVLFVHAINDISDTIPHINEDIQSIGIEMPPERAISFADMAVKAGASRLPKIGRMLNFEMPWDGIILIDRLVKWNTLFGPMR